MVLALRTRKKPKVNERFYHGDASRGTPGVGLGPALVKEMAPLHRGSLKFADDNLGLVATLKVSCCL
jgi:signal transduction histidine kinase